MPSPVQLTLTATSDVTIAPLIDTEKAAVKAIYEACCAAEGSCEAWNQASIALKGENSDIAGIYSDLCNVDNNVCDVDGSLVSLYLDAYGLSCDISALNFSAFTALEYLSMARNSLTGDFETGVKNIADQAGIKLLDVGANTELGGAIDASGEGGLCTLAEFGLIWLGLYRTAVEGPIPACLFDDLSKVQELIATNSSLGGALPDSMSTSSTLVVLQLGSTKVEGTIPEVPSSMVMLNMASSGISGAFPDVSAATSLTTVILSNNQLTGAVSDSVAGHPSLRYLDVSENALTGLPAAWTDAPSSSSTDGEAALPLNTVYLNKNSLQTTFPAGLATYPNIAVLNVANTEATGPLPVVAEGEFSSLVGLLLQNNYFDGAIPDSWQNSALFGESSEYTRTFILSNNSLTGAIPDFIGQPYSDMVIRLDGNEFDNGCDDAFKALGACPDDGSSSNSTTYVDTNGDGVPDRDEDRDGDGIVNGDEDMDGDGIKNEYDEYDYDYEYSEFVDANGDGVRDEGSVAAAIADGTAYGGEEVPTGGGGGGLSGGVIAAIALVVIGVVGVAGFVLYQRHQRHGSGAGKFQRFEDDGGLEMGTRPGGSGANPNVYNTQLAP